MAQISELKGVELPAWDWLEKLGWSKLSDKDLQSYKRQITNPVIDALLLEAIININNIDAVDAQRAMDILYTRFALPNSLDANEQFIDKLTKGVTLTIKNENRTIHFIDYDEIWNNTFIATRQYIVQGNDMVKPDLVLLVNGIPLVCIEAKQRARQSVSYFAGIEQLNKYEYKVPKLYICNLFGVTCNGKFSKYGTLNSSASYFFEWKDSSLHNPENNPVVANSTFPTTIDPETNLLSFAIDPIEQMKSGLCGLLQPERIIDILLNFNVFEHSQENGVIKKIARYQQFRAANKIIARSELGDMKHGVIWHTQGSGKSLTILFTAYKLRNDVKLKDPTVFIIVDRKDLKDQIGDTFEECDFPNTFKPTNSGQLKQKIQSQSSEVIITTIQKFREMNGLTDSRENVFVLIDEAHRTQYGDYHSELKAVLPNSSRYAFTGTPIPKTVHEFGKITSTQFEKYFDRYKIQDAIDDCATVEIVYTYGPTELQLNKEDLKKGWEEITEELSEEEQKVVERKAQPWKTVIKKESRIALIAKDIAEDFRSKVEPNGFKAQVVAVDKEACVTYFDQLVVNGFSSDEIQIVFSKSHGEKPEKEIQYRDHYLSEGELKKVIKKFKKRITPEEKKNGNNLKILIVCNMLLTGFDAPIEQTMYLDSPFRDHTLLQAIARTNRPYDDKVTGVSKKYGRIVDYLGIFNDLNAALNYDPADIGTFRDEAKLFEDFPTAIEKAMSYFIDIKLDDSYECSIAITRKLNNIDVTEFEKDFRKVVQLYEAISPSALLVPYFKKYQWLLAIYNLYVSEFKRLDFDAEFYAAKTRKLIQDTTIVKSFKGHLPEVKIDKNYINTLNASKLNPDDKAEKIIRDIETVIRRNELRNPVYTEFYKRMEELIKQKKEKSKSIEDLLIELEGLFDEVEEAENLPEKLGFQDKNLFYIFQVIKNKSGEVVTEDDIKKIVFDIGNIVKDHRYTGWQESDLEKRDLRTEIATMLCDDQYLALNLCGDDELTDELLERISKDYAL